MLAVLLAAAEEEPRIHIPETDELIWGSLAFVILFGFLAWKVFPMMRKTLAERAQRIKGSLEGAERTRSEADQVLEQYRQQLAQARQEANQIIEEAKRTAESLRRDLVSNAEREAQDIVARARAEVAGERDRAIQELRGTLGDLSLELASRVIERELADPRAQRAVVDQAINDLARSGNGQSQG